MFVLFFCMDLKIKNLMSLFPLNSQAVGGTRLSDVQIQSGRRGPSAAENSLSSISVTGLFSEYGAFTFRPCPVVFQRRVSGTDA